jgi:TonB family protein
VKSPVAAERIQALQSLRGRTGVQPDALDPVADNLLDDVEEVRHEAAITLTQLALRLGCQLKDFPKCAAFDRVLDNTPTPEKRPFPRYPREAKEKLSSGSVIVQCLVLEDGSVRDVRVLQGGPPFAGAAIEAVSQHRYLPAKRKGRAVPFTQIVILTFNLRVGEPVKN